MKRLICATLLGLLCGGTVAAAAQSKDQATKHTRKERAKRADIHVVFGAENIRVIREYFAPRYRNLPPGLQKKLVRGGHLPPGWRKRFEPFPAVLDDRLPALPEHHRRGVIDGQAVIYDTRSNVIVDVALLF